MAASHLGEGVTVGDLTKKARTLSKQQFKAWCKDKTPRQVFGQDDGSEETYYIAVPGHKTPGWNIMKHHADVANCELQPDGRIITTVQVKQGAILSCGSRPAGRHLSTENTTMTADTTVEIIGGGVNWTMDMNESTTALKAWVTEHNGIHDLSPEIAMEGWKMAITLAEGDGPNRQQASTGDMGDTEFDLNNSGKALTKWLIEVDPSTNKTMAGAHWK